MAVLVVLAVIAGVATFLLTKGDIKNLKSVLTSNKPVEVTGKIELLGDTELTMPYHEEFVEPGFSATDEKTGDLTANVQTRKEELNENEYNLIYEVKDSNGNTVEAKRHISLIDDVAPVITLNGNKNLDIV